MRKDQGSGRIRDPAGSEIRTLRLLLHLLQGAAVFHLACLEKSNKIGAGHDPGEGRYRLAQRLLRFALRFRAKDGWVSGSPRLTAGWTRAQRDLPAAPEMSFRELWKEDRI